MGKLTSYQTSSKGRENRPYTDEMTADKMPGDCGVRANDTQVAKGDQF